MKDTPQTRRQPFIRALSDDGGSVAIETALGFMLVMAMVLGIIEVSMMAYTFGVLEEAAREGVRYASIHGTDSSTCSGPSNGCTDSSAANVVNDVTTYAANYVGDLSGMQVNVTYPDGISTATSRVQVAIIYNYKPLFNIPGMTPVLSISSEGRIMY